MRAQIKDRHLYGAGAAACAICCAPPILALLGIAGAGIAATVATLVIAGVAFALVVLAATLIGVWARCRRTHAGTESCSNDGPVAVSISTRPSDTR